MDLVKNKKDCCGCGVCYNICPKKAISMVEDEYGYIYPKIDEKKCIECGLCKKSCVYQTQNKRLNEPIKTYAAISKDEKIINKSASGGIFATIAKNILNDGGVIYGASLEKEDKSFKVKHIRIDKEKDLIKLQGSKYVQSDTSEIYCVVKKDLEDGKKVLFSGTPCQVNAVKGYLNFKDYDNLYTIDLICHGVPNKKMFNDYIKILEQKEKGEVIDFNFRDKSKDKGAFCALAKIRKINHEYKKIIPSFESSYYQLFLDSNIYRENCYTCPYANGKRTGDITLGDYWKFEIEHPEYLNKVNIKKGISCLIVNTEKGIKITDELSRDMKILNSEFNKVKKHNAQLVHPSIISNENKKILSIYSSKGYKGVNKYYFQKNFIKVFLKRILFISNCENVLKVIRNRFERKT